MEARSHPVVAALDGHDVREDILVRRPSRRWPAITLFMFIACVVAAIGEMAWWDNYLSTEEQSVLGCWVSIDTSSYTFPNGTSSLTCNRELKFLPGHEVRLRVWVQGDPKRVEMVPFLGGRGYLYPQVAKSSDSLSAMPHPAVLPDSVLSASIAPVNASGQWAVKNGRIEIEWNVGNSLFQTIHKKYDEIVHNTGTLSISKNANGVVTQNQDDKLTINWTSNSTRLGGYVSPPQVWSRQQ